ncbi:ATP-binding protein (plasmid) [Pseudomonas silvicola]|nr:ATP-binding protein [Pseudomonas silvicola]
MTDALPAPMFEFDPLFIIRIVSSLLRNAIQHTEQGEIAVAIYPLETLKARWVPSPVIEVSDQGNGFTPPHSHEQPRGMKRKPTNATGR